MGDIVGPMQKSDIRWGIRAKLILAMTSLVFVIIVVTMFLGYQSRVEIITANTLKSGRIITKALAERSIDPLIQMDFPLLESYAVSLAAEDGITLVAIMDDKGNCVGFSRHRDFSGTTAIERLTATAEPEMSKNVRDIPGIPELGRSFEAGEMAVSRTRDYVSVGIPVLAGDQRRGTVLVMLSLAELKKEIEAIIRLFLKFGIMAILMGLLTAVFMSKLIVRAIESLVVGAEQVAIGNFKHRTEVTTMDELGLMANTFNRMAGNVDTLYKISSAMNILSDSEELLTLILDEAVKAIEAERGSLMLLDDTTDELFLKVIHGIDELPSTEKRITLKLGEGVAGKVVESGKSQLVNQGYRDDGFKSFSQARERELKVRSLLCVPLLVEGQPLGVINIVNKLGGTGNFTTNDMKFLEVLASHASVAINNNKLYELAITDGMTKLFIHRHFQNRLDEEIIRARRYGSPLSLVMFDIDHFKSFNDTYGHQQGDVVIVNVAKVIKENVREIDIAARYGGEEFAVVLPQTDVKGAVSFAERLRARIESFPFPGQEKPLHVTISLGIACYPYSSTEKMELIKHTDEALYESKEGGRNMWTVHQSVRERLNLPDQPEALSEAYDRSLQAPT